MLNALATVLYWMGPILRLLSNSHIQSLKSHNMQVKTIFLMALLCCSLPTYSQNDSVEIFSQPEMGSFNEDYKPWEYRSSEFGINVAPLAVEAIGGYNNKPRYSLTYQLADAADAFRVNIGWMNYDPISSAGVYIQDDETLIRQQTTTTTDVYDLRLGYARFIAVSNFRIEYGADLILGMKNVEEKSEYLTSYATTEDPLYRNTPELEGPPLSSKYNLLGVTPFLGVTAMFGRHFGIQAQTGPTVVYNRMVSPVTLSEKNFWDVEYNYLSTINLMYKF